MVDFSEDVKACTAALLAGNTIAYPTDTVWGIGCDATNEAAVKRVFALKRRPREKSLIVLLPAARDVLQYIAAPPPDIIAIIEAFDRPTTVILDGALGLADNVIAEDGSVALRIPQDPFCNALLKRFGKPIVSTSANISGGEPALIFAGIDGLIIKEAGYVAWHRRDDTEQRRPSRIVRMNAEGAMTILRD